VIPYGTLVPVAVRRVANPCYFTYLLPTTAGARGGGVIRFIARGERDIDSREL